MGADVFFLSHNHAENGSEDDAVSKYNDYEVRSRVPQSQSDLVTSNLHQVSIIKDLVIYLLR